MAARITQTSYVNYHDDNTTRTGEIEFFVITENPMDNPLEAVGTPPDPAAIPAKGTPHPFNVGQFFAARVDRRTVVPMDSTGRNWKVTLLYSSDGRFRFQPNIDQTQATRLSAEEFIPKELKYPFITQRPVVTAKAPPSTPGGQAAFDITFDWQKQEGSRTLFQENYQVRIVLGQTGQAGVYGPNEERAIRAQYQKFHYLAPNPYEYTFPQEELLAPDDVIWPTTYKELWQFNGCAVNQIGPATWHLTYSWVRDSGNFRLAPATWTPNPPQGTTNTAVYPLARPPFFQYQVIQRTPLPNTSGPPIVSPPRIIVVPTYSDGDVTGYAGAHGLPGVPV